MACFTICRHSTYYCLSAEFLFMSGIDIVSMWTVIWGGNDYKKEANTMDIVQWAVTFHTVADNHEPDAWKIVSDPKLSREYGDEHGITRRAVVKEMLRLGKDGANMFWAIDESKAREQGARREKDGETAG